MASSIELGKELECSVCLENFQKPKLLSCMHTFCEGCIEKLIENQVINCPECRDITKVPNGVIDLHTNYIAQNVVEKLKTADKGPSCHECVGNTVATKYCQTCGLNLCPDCSKFHSRGVRFVGHKIEDVSKAPDLIAPTSRYCSKHQELLKYYCETCHVLVCNDCMVSKHHKNHQIALVEEIRSRIVDELNQQIQIGEQAEVIIKEHLTEGKDFKKRIKKANEKSAAMLAEIFEEIRKAVTKREEQLMEAIHERSNTRSFDDFEKKAKKLSEILNYVKSISAKGKCQNVEILSDLKAQLTCQLNEIQAQAILQEVQKLQHEFVNLDPYKIMKVPKQRKQRKQRNQLMMPEQPMMQKQPMMHGQYTWQHIMGIHPNQQMQHNQNFGGNLLSVANSEIKTSSSGALNYQMYLVDQTKHNDRDQTITNILDQFSV